MGQVTHEQAHLLLKLYELRREPRLRQARTWYITNFNVHSFEELMQKFPPPSEEGTNIRMMITYWDMAASIFNQGLVDEDLFFENSGELWIAWDRIRPIIAGWRTLFKNPTIFSNLEQAGARFEEWRERRAPGSNETLRQLIAQMTQQARAKAAS